MKIVKLLIVYVVVFVLGCLVGGVYEKSRVKSADEISVMVDQTLAYHQKELDSLQSLTAAEKKKLGEAAKQILKKYLPEEPQKQENQKTEGGEK